MIQILISSSVLILVMILARQFLRQKVSQRLIYSLWLLVALRLLIPVEVGQSVYSLTAVTRPATQQVQQAVSRPISGPDQEVLYQQLLQEYMASQPQNGAPLAPEVQTQLQQQAQQKAAPSYQQLLKWVWLGGMAGMALWFLITNLLFLRKVRKNSTLWGYKAGIPVRVCPYVPSPCLVGLSRPSICITPDSVEDEVALSHIFAHERAHLRHRDPLWSLVRCLCLCVYWFHPLVWVAALLSKQDCELACDEGALETLGDQARIPYGKTLMQVVMYSRSPAHIMEVATSMSASKSQLKERMCRIVKKQKTVAIAAVVLILVAVFATGCAFVGDAPSSSVSHPPKPSQTPSGSTAPSSSAATVPSGSTTTLPSGTAGNGGLPDAEEILAIATDLIARYSRFQNISICCDSEWVQEDLSRYMSQAQRDYWGDKYYGTQWKITCCSTPEEVEAHARQLLGDAQMAAYTADQILFTDEAGNLYLPVIPTGGDGYHGLRIRWYSDREAVVLADASIEYTYTKTVAFRLRQKDGHWCIEEAAVVSTAVEDVPNWMYP